VLDLQDSDVRESVENYVGDQATPLYESDQAHGHGSSIA
jgi:hypothetical protein